MPRMRVCPQCREGFQLAATGRPPTYCSTRCRKAAWEQKRIDDAVAAALELERQRPNRGDETRAAAGNRGNETAAATQSALLGDECPYCREIVLSLVPHLQECPRRPGAD